jgi:hypothetical protein
MIALDNGNKSNYSEGDEIIISVFSEADDVVVISKDGEIIEEVKTYGRAFFPRVFTRGYYTASLKCSGESVEFAVTSAQIRFEVCGGSVTVIADPMDGKSEILHMEFRKSDAWFPAFVKYEDLTDAEKKSQLIRRELAPGGDMVKVYFKNSYGIWSHPAIKIY